MKLHHRPIYFAHRRLFFFVPVHGSNSQACSLTNHDFESRDSIDSMVRKHISEQSWDGGHAGKGTSFVGGHLGKGITSIQQLGMFGVGKSSDVRSAGTLSALGFGKGADVADVGFGVMNRSSSPSSSVAPAPASAIKGPAPAPAPASALAPA